MVILLVLLTLLGLIFAALIKRTLLLWRMRVREADIHRLRIAYCAMNDGGTKKYRFGKHK